MEFVAVGLSSMCWEEDCGKRQEKVQKKEERLEKKDERLAIKGRVLKHTKMCHLWPLP